MAKRMNFPPRREQRRKDAEARAAARAERSPAQQLDVLYDRGHAHCSEATAIAEAIRDGQAPRA